MSAASAEPTSRSISGLVKRAASAYGGRLAVACGTASLSFDELHDAAQAAGSALAGLGAGRGDRVGVCLRPCVDQVVTLLAAGLAGAVAVPIHPHLKAANIAHIAGDADLAVLVVDGQRSGELAAACAGTTVTTAASLSVPAPGVPAVPLSFQPDPGDLAALIYSSGSTGRPKGIMVTHENIVRGAEIVSGYLGTTADDRIAGLLTLNFDYGLNQLWQCLLTGASLHLHEFVMPRSAFTLLAAERITALPLMPALVHRLFAPRFGGPPDGLDFSAVRYVSTTGGSMSAWALSCLRDTFGDAQVYLMYGLTEAFRSSFLPPAELDRRPASVGKAVPGVTLHVVDDTGRDCAPGETGTLIHRGACITAGYWNDPERTGRVFRHLDRFPGETVVWSGDLATTDSDGYVYILGRSDFQLKRDGFRISPSEIEDVIGQHPAVAASVVLGLDDADRGHRIVAAWSARPGRTQADGPDPSWLGERLPPHMVPSELRYVAALPTTANGGKFDRLAVRQLFTTPALVSPIVTVAAGQPDRPALRWRDETVTYGELASRVRAVADLVAGCTAPNARVVIEARRDPDTVCAILGVLAAGRCYVPLNPREPASRRATMLAMTGAEYQVSGGTMAPLPGPAVAAAGEACVFFTSGSTGTPKGVPISHDNALAFVEWARSAFALSPGDRIGVYSPLFFDLSVFDLFAGLSAGAELVLVPEELVAFSRAVFECLRDAAVTVLYTVPSALRGLLAAADGLCLPALAHLLLAGEPFPADELDRIRRIAPRAALHNLYGPIEANVVSSFTVPDDWPVGQPVPIGTAVSGATLALVGSDGCLRTGQGERGEILIKGPSVFNGYLPGMAPPPDPFVVVAGERWYRTGDMARVNADGALEFEGRRDHRIKRRGFLVDLSEIEAVLARHQDVAVAAVIALDRTGSDTPVHAFVAPAPGRALTAAAQLPHAMEQWCRLHLPRYMWPSRVHVLPSLPLGRTGKIDRQRLTELAADDSVMAGGERR